MAALGTARQGRARHESMQETGNLTVLHAKAERSVIGHVVPQIKPVIKVIKLEESDRNIFAACYIRSNLLID